MPKLYILCGIPCSGKTTWANEFLKTDTNDTRYVSRDEIRFSMLKDDEDYFAHEKEVFEKFAGIIAQTLIDGFDVIADATHLNRFSRKKLTNTIDKYVTNYQIKYIVFYTPMNECLVRNVARESRAQVPADTIKGMRRSFQAPVITEDARAIDIVNIGEDNDFAYLMEPYRRNV